MYHSVTDSGGRVKLNKIQVRGFLITAVLSLALVGGCGKSSSTDSGTDEETDDETEVACSTEKCGKGKSCEGTYSTLSCTGKKWTGVCKVNQIDSGDWTKIWFEDQSNCGFDWVRAQGTVGSDWATLASGSAKETMVESKGEDVFQLRICTNGVNTDNTRCL